MENIDVEMLNQALENSFTEKDITIAIDELEENSALGPNETAATFLKERKCNSNISDVPTETEPR